MRRENEADIQRKGRDKMASPDVTFLAILPEAKQHLCPASEQKISLFYFRLCSISIS